MLAVSFLLHVTTGTIKKIEIHNLEAVVWWRPTNQIRLCTWGAFLKRAQSV